MISWKHSFKKLNEEYEMAKKKKQALDNLLNDGRISQPTYDTFNNEIDEVMKEIEKQQKALLEKMNSKMQELEKQIKTLETLLANYEIQHVTGEVEEEVYQREIGILSIGIETARHELDTVKDAVNQLSTNPQIPTTDTAIQQEVESQPREKEATKTEVEIVEEPSIEVKETDSSQTPQEQTQETPQSSEESPSTEAVTKEETQET